MNTWSVCFKPLAVAAILSGVLAGPIAVSAATLPVVDGTTVGLTLEAELAHLFDATNPDNENYLAFDGPGVLSGHGGAMAPVSHVSVTGPGAFTINWGSDVQFGDALGVVQGRNLSLSLADQVVYADITFNIPGSDPLAFTHVAAFSLVGLSGSLDGIALDQVDASHTGPGLLSLQASVFANIDGLNPVLVGLGSEPLPTDGSAAFKVGELSIGVSAVPEPATWATMGLGLAGLLLASARRRRIS